MPRYEITAQGRKWNCEAVDREWALRLFEVNIGKLDAAALATLRDVDDYVPTANGKAKARKHRA